MGLIHLKSRLLFFLVSYLKIKEITPGLIEQGFCEIVLISQVSWYLVFRKMAQNLSILKKNSNSFRYL